MFLEEESNFDDAESVVITNHIQRKGSKIELLPLLKLQKHVFILLIIPKKFELYSTIFLVLLKIEVFHFFLKFEEVEQLYGPNEADVDIKTKHSLDNSGSKIL